MRKILPLLISAAVAAGTWMGIRIWDGRTEAWDSSLYWSVGFPFMLIAVLLIAIKWPEKPWRYGLVVMATQAFVGAIPAFPNLQIWPLSLIMFFILSLPLVVTASIGSIVRKRFSRKEKA